MKQLPAICAASALFAIGTAGATAAPKPLNGVWEGATSDGFVRFTVVGRQVRRMAEIHRCAAEGGNLWGTFRVLAIRPSGAFRLTSPFGSGISGRFVSRSRATGTFNVLSLGIPPCATAGPRRFTATRVKGPVIAPKLGLWKGTDAGGGTLTFTVQAGGRIENITLSGTSACATRNGNPPFASGTLIRPSTASFEARQRPVPVGGSAVLSEEDFNGTFTSPTAASGTLRAAFPNSTRPCESGPVAWTAVRA